MNSDILTDEVIKKHEALLTKAEKDGDGVALNELLADDFAGINLFGCQIDKRGFVSHACNPDIEISQLNVIESSIKVIGSVAVVIGKAEFNSTFKGKPVDGATRFMDVWELRFDKCLLISSTVSIDGASRG